MNPVRYRITALHPHAHIFQIACTVTDPDPAGQAFRLPAWVPGSYLIREFARHFVGMRATCAGAPVDVVKTAKDVWQVAPCAGELTLVADVYAFDLSVRAAFLDATRGFFNGPSVFVWPVGHEQRPCELEIVAPVGDAFRDWRVATSLPRAGASAYGFGTYRAASYDELVDHPVEMGTFDLVHFEAGGARHDIAVTGRQRGDLGRLAHDVQRICQSQIDLYAGAAASRAPLDHYVFQLLVLGEGYGGLEHRASTSLVSKRDALPTTGTPVGDDDYRKLLGLFSHEYFHTWNVKRIKPAAFTPYDLNRENHTTLLWAFEGFTSYYDDLLLVRSGLTSRNTYLEALGRDVTSLLRTSGRTKQTVAESSFDAWIKYYRSDENTPNAGVSYYSKGSLIALCLDLLIRNQTNGRKSLDDVVRALWKRYGMSGIGVPEDGIEKIAEQVTGVKLKRFFDQAVRSTADLPLQNLLATVGIDMALRPSRAGVDRRERKPTRPEKATGRGVTLGVRTGTEGGHVRITHVLDGGPAQKAGLAAGDIVMAMDGLRVTPDNFDNQLSRYRPGEAVTVHGFRRDELLVLDVTPAAAKPDAWSLSVNEDKAGARARKRWLGTA
jgi:predicted metalloprotease with PDZ domain